MRKYLLLMSVLALSFLLLIPTIAQEGNLVEVAENNFLSTLVATADAAGLADTLADENASLTIFAPTNAAFQKTLDSLGITAEDLMADTETLSQILLYHVVDGQVLAEDVVGLTEVETLEGSSISVTATDNGVFLNNVVTITATNLAANNGVIHIIDSVLLPPALFAPAHVRVGHFSPDTPSVDVYLNGKVSAIQDLEYPSTTGWVDVPAGSYNVAVAPANTSVADAAIGPIELSFAADSWTTVAAVGSLERGTLSATVFDEAYGAELALGSARVTVLHAIDTAPAVDVRAGGTNLVTALAFPGSFGNNDGAFTLDVPAGTYDLNVVASGSVVVAEPEVTPDPTAPETTPEPVPGALISLPGTTIEAGQFYFIAAIGSIGEPTVYVETYSMDGMGDMEVSRSEAPIGTLAANNFFTTLVAAADAAGLTDALNDPEASLTVFVPTNAAFAALLEEMGITAEELLADTDLLTDVLLYHVVDGEVPAATIATLGGQEIETLQGGTISVSITAEGVVLNGSVNVVNTDLYASNGVIHVIDGVLLPPAGE